VSSRLPWVTPRVGLNRLSTRPRLARSMIHATAAGSNFKLVIGVVGVTSGEALAGVFGPRVKVPVRVSLVYVGVWDRRHHSLGKKRTTGVAAWRGWIAIPGPTGPCGTVPLQPVPVRMRALNARRDSEGAVVSARELGSQAMEERTTFTLRTVHPTSA
jgi:hypothetical protein